MISPIMICVVSDGRYHGRRTEETARLMVADESSTDFADCCRLRNQETANLRNLRTILLSMFVTHLECSACPLRHDSSRLQNLCTSCHKPLFAINDFAAAGRKLSPETLAPRGKSLGLFGEGLPLPEGVGRVSLGEGGTPLLRAPGFGGAFG